MSLVLNNRAQMLLATRVMHPEEKPDNFCLQLPRLRQGQGQTHGTECVWLWLCSAEPLGDTSLREGDYNNSTLSVFSTNRDSRFQQYLEESGSFVEKNDMVYKSCSKMINRHIPYLSGYKTEFLSH